jgi:mono/diheme cytochrome c family protein
VALVIPHNNYLRCDIHSTLSRTGNRSFRCKGISTGDACGADNVSKTTCGYRAAGGTIIGEDQVISPLTDEESLAEGKAVYDKNCTPCHGISGEGVVGTNITDEYWIHGAATMNDMVRTIVNGVPAKGIVPWGPILRRDEIIKVASYIRTLRGTNPPNGKAPQGEKVAYGV